MTFPLNTLTLRGLSALLCTTSLVACGGGGGTTATTDSVQAGLVVVKGSTGTATGVVTALAPAVPAPTATPSPAPVATANGTLVVITDVRLENTGTVAQTAIPVTFGQVFAVGHVKKTDVLVGRFEDNTLVALQMDVKARHADGSVRHAIFSAIIPQLAANTTRTMSLVNNATVTGGTVPLPADLLSAGFTASASATIAGVKYSASADQLLKGGTNTTWLSGTVANEWQVSAPLKTATGVAHPHLTARFAVRYYFPIKKARVDVTIENNWAYEPAIQNFKYDAEIVVGGKQAYFKADLTHYVQARWRKLFWWGGDAPDVNTMLNTKYLIASRAVPNYDQTITISPAKLAEMDVRMAGDASEPMGLGMATAYMPTTGAHEDIGLLPSWAASYVLSMDKRARDATLGTGNAAGSFSAHYRDKNTDRPVSLKNYPYMTILGRETDTWNEAAKRLEAFPACAADCTTPYTHDTAHQPGLAYLPYLVTGDYYYLEEMQFWAMYDTFVSNPNYREHEKGLLTWDQLRGQGWSLRTLAEAAYITPDTDALKADLVTMVNDNLDWYNTAYSNNPSANKLGVPTQGYSIAYNNDTSISTWMDDFFTSAVGHTADLGFTRANALLAWKAKFPVARMTAPGTCWIMGAPYSLRIRTSTTTPVFDSVVDGYTADLGAEFMKLPCNSPEMAAKLGLKLGDMGNISDGNMGYPSNMQPALAYSADSGIASSKTAWSLFMGRTVKPDYSTNPQFAIVPR